MTEEDLVDVAIVGGGPAGTQAALVLVRANKSVVVFDEPRPPRNADSRGMHNVFGMDGLLPTEIRDITWKQIDFYGGVELRRAEVLSVRREDGAFELETADGRKTRARNVIAAFGYRDVHPEIPGFSACWSSNIIPCPFCDGYENRGGIWGIVPTTPAEADHFPAFAANWADSVIVIVSPTLQLPDDYVASQEAKGYRVKSGLVSKVHHESGRLLAVTLNPSERVEVSTLLWQPPTQRVPLLDRMICDLGLEVLDNGTVVTDDVQQTNVSGLFAVGDLKGWSGAVGAAYMGNRAAAYIVRTWYM